jgi:hypothetical protein
MTVTERKRLVESTDVLCAELQRDDRDLGEILFSMTDEEVSPGERDNVVSALQQA